MIAKTLGEILAVVDPPPARMPVLNRDPRELLGIEKWTMLRLRDHLLCWMCREVADSPVIDHLVPRSSFRTEELDLADRSDNLRVACWGCNSVKSNFAYDLPVTAGVVLECFWCKHGPGFTSEDDSDGWALYWADWDLPHEWVRAFCGACHEFSDVPDEGWLL